MAKVDKLLEQAQPHLNPGEQVLAVIQGTYETKIMGSDTVRTGIMMATQDRVVFYAKKLGGFDLESFLYGSISSFEQSKNMMGHSIAFFASGNRVNMKWIGDAAAMQQFVTTVKERIGPSASGLGSYAPVGEAPAPTQFGPPPSAQQLAPPPPQFGPPSSAPPFDSPPSPPAERTDDKAAIIDAIKQLGELRQAGVLTDEEFSLKKAELLSRL